MARRLPSAAKAIAHEILLSLYGHEVGERIYRRLATSVTEASPRLARRVRSAREGQPLDHQDAFLITYGDQMRTPGEAPLQTLAAFARRYLRGLVSGVHVLPFFPSSSDDGFAVVDYYQVDPELGSWDDLRTLGEDFRLMFDAVINHVSSRSRWFQGFLAGEQRYRDFFIRITPDMDLTPVVRPRALPLVTAFQTASGEERVWTTFSADQVDLNYANPEVLLAVLDVLLEYIARGAQILRLDAIAYLWKQAGTPSIHLPQTHQVVRLIRAMLDWVAPHVFLITETNVPHQENLSYFGDGTNEAQLVYNFALPPLVLHTFLSGDATKLTEWAASLHLPSTEVAFFNFLASHDGIGLNPVRGILSEAEIERLVRSAQERGGLVGLKAEQDGSQSAYELNINYFDALNDAAAGETLDLQVKRFLGAHAILLSLAGLPGIYVHSLLGSRGWPEGVRQTGRNRSINRQKFERDALLRELSDATGRRARILAGFERLLRVRSSTPAFDPYGEQRVLSAGSGAFAVLRLPPDGSRPVLCLQSVLARRQTVRVDVRTVKRRHGGWRDVCTNQIMELGGVAEIQLEPYQVLWLQPE
jgi:glycosidase